MSWGSTNDESPRVDHAHTFGGRPYDVKRCEHGCCAAAVCDFLSDCDRHDDTYTVEQIAEFYSVAPTVPLRGGQQGFATGVAPAGTNTEPNVGAA